MHHFSPNDIIICTNGKSSINDINYCGTINILFITGDFYVVHVWINCKLRAKCRIVVYVCTCAYATSVIHTYEMLHQQLEIHCNTEHGVYSQTHREGMMFLHYMYVRTHVCGSPFVVFPDIHTYIHLEHRRAHYVPYNI